MKQKMRKLLRKIRPLFFLIFSFAIPHSASAAMAIAKGIE